MVSRSSQLTGFSKSLGSSDNSKIVMPGLVPGIHVFTKDRQRAWMAGHSPSKTGVNALLLRP